MRIAGWVYSVSRRRSSGPSKQSCAQLVAEDAVGGVEDLRARRASPRQRSAPMPTSWAPWPGKQPGGRSGLGRPSGRNERAALFAKARALDLDGLSALVVAADGTGVVRPAHGAALRAAREAGELERQVAAALALARFWVTFLWQWGHGYSFPSRSRPRKAGKPGPAAVDCTVVAAAVAVVEVADRSRGRGPAVRPAQRLHFSGDFAILPYCLREVEHVVLVDEKGVRVGARRSGAGRCAVDRR